METLKYALTLVSQNCFSCSLDLQDTYVSVYMAPAAQNFLKFVWKGQLYKFTAFPNGLASCPRLFTKFLKPVMAHLHKLGFISTFFIDYTLLAWTGVYQECQSFPAAVWKARVCCSPCEVSFNPISLYHLSWVHLKLGRHDHYSHWWEKEWRFKSLLLSCWRRVFVLCVR